MLQPLFEIDHYLVLENNFEACNFKIGLGVEGVVFN